MPRTLRGSRALLVACISLSAAMGACGGSPTFLRPAAPDASQTRGLWWILFTTAAVVFAAVVAILVYGALRRPSQAEERARHAFGTPLVWIGGITIPAMILFTVFGLSIVQMTAANGGDSSNLTIEVVGHQWWWEVRYPHDKVVTANEVHLPVNQPARVVITSADVIHAFWVPELQGKIDAIPGQSNSIRLQASREGTYRGECLTYCGLQHANMNFVVVAQPADQFQAWLSAQSAAPPAPAGPQLVRGQQIFLGSACVYCHTIEGTNASGRVGPDLTHLASRPQLAAGTIPNTPGALGGWIVDPQTIKPGNKMPPENFSGPDLQALIAYLESLK